MSILISTVWDKVRSTVLHLNGDYSEGDHLFPFRTEKLSPSTLMVLG